VSLVEVKRELEGDQERDGFAGIEEDLQIMGVRL